jgi:cysteinyl-tRNA synthetase
LDTPGQQADGVRLDIVIFHFARFDSTMDLKLYDTLTREKRVFTPLDPANVRMYVCGPTVYDFAHIGNARPVIVFDVLFRLLRHIYGEKHVTYVRNITDVDDKINARAAQDFPGLPLNEAIRKVTEATEAQFQADVKALDCLPPTHQPRATEFVLPRSDGRMDMKSLIQELLDRGNAYVAEGTEGKEVLFDVSSMPDYGALSGRKLEDQKAGARIAVDAHKKNPGDFVLWKESGAKEPGWKGEFVPDPRSGYDAEFIISSEDAVRLGRNSRVITIHGRPGWHIECSAMSAAYLGKVFDIHGGGLDLIFPHHENEIAQSRCAFHTPVMANYWMHNGFLQVEGEKMSKSLGNFVTIHELLTNWRGLAWPGEVIRFALLQSHYRQPMDFTERALEEAAIALRGFSVFAFDDPGVSPSAEFLEAMADDVNTPRAIAELHRLHRAARDGATGLASRMARPGAMLGESDFLPASQLASGLSLLGFRIKEYDQHWLQKQITTQRGPQRSAEIERLVKARTEARRREDWKESDRIRDELAKMGVVLKDTKDGTTWEIAR